MEEHINELVKNLKGQSPDQIKTAFLNDSKIQEYLAPAQLTEEILQSITTYAKIGKSSMVINAIFKNRV